jgi:hypothetical protein
MRGRQEPDKARKEIFGQKTMRGVEALVRVGEIVTLIQDQVFVQEGRAGSPMADDENRGL